MLPYFWYLLKVIICSGILLGYYWLFLRNKIFHQYNRFYLLVAMGLSMLLPLLKINFWQQQPETNGAIRVLRAVSVGDEYMNTVVISAQKSLWNFQNLYPLFYWLVSVVFVIFFLRTLYIIRTLFIKYPARQIDEVTFINTNDDSTPFSFFKYIFWNSSIDMDTVTGRQIFKHEIAHIQEKHTYDKLFVNILLIFFWCNPFFWLYRKELNMIHEFIADKKAVEDSDTAAFAAMILQTAYPRHRFELTNNFFYSPIKRRLRMLTKFDNPRISYLVRVMVLPLAVLVFAAFTFKAKTNNLLYHGKKITVVIDAGHGGEKDPGARSTDGILEKDLALAFAKKVKELNSNNDIDIILTRNEDIYMSPMQRVEFTKSKNAILYISFHVDGEPVTKNPKRSGMSFWISNDQNNNSTQSKILASALFNEFNKNYGLKIIGDIKQRQKGIWALKANDCAAVIIETGFITNTNDVAYLKTEAAKETIAKNVLMAIEKYASSQSQINMLQNNKPLVDTLPDTLPVNLKLTDTMYAKNEDFKNKALVIVDSKIIGNVGYNYVNANTNKYNSLNFLTATEAKNTYGIKGKYGAIILTQNSKPTITAKSLTFDNKSDTIILTGPNIKFTGDFSDALIYLDNKLISYEQLKNIDPMKIGSAMLINNKKQSISTKSTIYIFTKIDDLNKLEIEDINHGIADKATQTNTKDLLQKEIQLQKISADKELSLQDKKNREQELKALKQKLNQLNEDLLLKEKTVEDKKISEQKIIEDRKITDKKLKTQNILLEQQVKDIQVDNKIFIKTEVSAQFIGGQAGWQDFVRKNLRANIPVDSGASAGKYLVIVKFIIHTDGSVSDVKCENDPGFGTCEEVKRIIKLSSKKWEPAIQNGKKVTAYHKQPVTFVVEE